MRIILNKEVETLGKAHDVVEVKPGYGRNYLIPQGFARIANKRNLASLEAVLEKERAAAAKILAVHQATAAKLEGKVLRIGAKAGTSGKIFGSVTNIQLAEAMASQFDAVVDRKLVTIIEEVKELGTYAAEVNLHPEVKFNVNFNVVEE